MNFNELKELSRRMGGVLVVNGNVPEFVVLPYSAYKSLEAEAERSKPKESFVKTENEETAEIERLNKEILALKEEIRQKEEVELAEAELTLDNEKTSGEEDGDGTIDNLAD